MRSNRRGRSRGGRLPDGPDQPEAPESIKSTILAASGFNVAAGLWLVIAPFALGDADLGAPRWISVLGGLWVACFGAIRVFGASRGRFGSGYLSWANVVLGLGIAALPFLFGHSGASSAALNHVITGLAVASMGTSSALASRSHWADRARSRTRSRESEERKTVENRGRSARDENQRFG